MLHRAAGELSAKLTEGAFGLKRLRRPLSKKGLSLPFRPASGA